MKKIKVILVLKNMQQPTDQLKKALEQRETYRHKSFILMIQTAFMVGAPACLAAIIGVRLDAHYATGRRYTLIFLAVAFLISWIMIIIKYIKFNKKLMQAEKRVLSLKNQK